MRIKLGWMVALVVLGACGGETSGDGKADGKAGEKAGEAKCDLTPEALKGPYVWAMGVGSQLKPQWLFRGNFANEGGTQTLTLLMGSPTFNRVKLTGKKLPDGTYAYVEKDQYEGADFEKYKATNKSPNNRLRIVAKVEVDYACRVIMKDGWDAWIDGQERWKQSDLGSKTMMPIPADREYSFEISTERLRMFDAASSYKAAKEEGSEYQQYTVEYTKEPLAFWSPLTEKKEGCTYSIDMYRDDRPIEKGIAVTPEEKEGMLRWPYTIEFTYAGIGTLEMRRYRECGGQKERLGVADAIIDVDSTLKDADEAAAKGGKK